MFGTQLAAETHVSGPARRGTRCSGTSATIRSRYPGISVNIGYKAKDIAFSGDPVHRDFPKSASLILTFCSATFQ